MSEVKDKVEDSVLRDRVRKSLLKMCKEKFKRLVPICEYRIAPQNDDAICVHDMSSPIDCRFSTCPRLNPPLSETARIEGGLKLKAGEK